MAMKSLKALKMPAPKNETDPMLELEDMDLEEEAAAEEEPIEMEAAEEAGADLAAASDEDLQKELESRGFIVSKEEGEEEEEMPEMEMEDMEEEEA